MIGVPCVVMRYRFIPSNFSVTAKYQQEISERLRNVRPRPGLEFMSAGHKFFITIVHRL